MLVSGCNADATRRCSRSHARRVAGGDASGRRRWTPFRRGGCSRPTQIFRTSFRSLPRAFARKCCLPVQAVCPGFAIETARAWPRADETRGNFLAHLGGVVTTDLFLAAAGLDALAL